MTPFPRIARGTLLFAAALLFPVLAAGRAAPAAAQDLAPIVTRLPASTRALALGGAFPVGARDSDGVFYNAAFGEALRALSVGVQRYGAEATLVTASGGGEWWNGTVAFGVMAVEYGASDAQDEAGAGAREPAPGLGGGPAVAEQAVAVAYARTVRGIRAGITGKLMGKRHDRSRGETVAADLAVGMPAGPVFVGLAVRDAGRALRLAGETHALPARVALNAATLAAPVGPLDVALAAFAEQRLDRNQTSAGLGGEVSWWPLWGRTFSARAGVRGADGDTSPFSFGAGFTGDRIAIDWAYRDLEGPGTHRISLRWR
jgi:hypothetical protein